MDHKLLKTLQFGQYSVQYLLACQKAMKNNKIIISDALKVFDDEEALLDLRLAKMRYRTDSAFLLPLSLKLYYNREITFCCFSSFDSFSITSLLLLYCFIEATHRILIATSPTYSV